MDDYLAESCQKHKDKTVPGHSNMIGDTLLERTSRQREFSNWALDSFNYFEWGGNAFEDIGNESKVES